MVCVGDREVFHKGLHCVYVANERYMYTNKKQAPQAKKVIKRQRALETQRTETSLAAGVTQDDFLERHQILRDEYD